MIELTSKPIEVWKVLQSVVSDRAGALVHFIGTVRNEEGVHSLEYESYPLMARTQMERLAAEARRRWQAVGISIVHRTGRVATAEPAVVIAVSAPHRREAFACCEWLIDAIKKCVPIWKEAGDRGGERILHAAHG